MNISKEIKVALLVLSGILLFIFGFNYLKGENILGSSRTFYAVYNNAESLTVSTPVTISGLNVGKVVEINFANDGTGNVLVEILIDTDFQFSKNSKAELYDTGLIGGKAIAILPAFDGDVNAENGAYLTGSVKAGFSQMVNQRLTPLQAKMEKMMLNADQLLMNLNDVFDEKTKNNLKNSIDGLGSIILEFKSTSKSLNTLLNDDNSKLNKSLQNFEKTTSNLSKISDSLAKVNLGQTIIKLESTLNNFDNILVGLNKGEGTMGKLLKDDALYNNIEAATKELEALLEDVKLHPNRYTRILSKKEIPYKQPETN